VFFTIVFCFTFLSFVAQVKTQFRSACLDDSISLQRQIIQAEKELFALNSLSTTLRISEKDTRAAAIAASETPPVAAKLWEQVEQINQSRQALDKVQKGIIQATDLHIKIEKMRLLLKYNSDAYKMTRQWDQYLLTLIVVRPDGDTKMAVKAETSDLAPNYGLTDHYKREQTVAYKWQLRMATQNNEQHFVQSANTFELFCGTNPNQEDEKWSIEITKDKSY
jgi:hypothetical protein